MAGNWQDFLDLLEPQLRSRLFRSRGKQQLPPQAVDLREVILLASQEVASAEVVSTKVVCDRAGDGRVEV
jgi:hypothetical protein